LVSLHELVLRIGAADISTALPRATTVRTRRFEFFDGRRVRRTRIGACPIPHTRNGRRLARRRRGRTRWRCSRST